MSTRADVVVVGSGASGVHAAYPLVEAGYRVTMLDVGHEDLTYEKLIPPASFTELRRSDAAQHRYFLGDRLEGVAIGPSEAGPQITPPRSYVLRDSERLGPKRTRDFEALESFALGGLASAWGAVSFPFNDHELGGCGLPIEELRAHYEIVARRIGVSGDSSDDLVPLRGGLDSLQSPLKLDHNASAILDRYHRLRSPFGAAGLYLGKAMVAALSSGLDDREANSYTDMDFWANQGDSVYRPSITLRRLKSRANFTYQPGFLVTEFAEVDNRVEVRGRHLEGDVPQTFSARTLILAAGAIGTTRLVLRSVRQHERKVPFVCNGHAYMPCLNYRSLGQPHADRCHSLAQLTAIYDPTMDRRHLVQAQMYSYRSLLLFRLLKETPLAYAEGLKILRALAPQIVIWVIQHEDVADERNYCVLRGSGANETLEIVHSDTPERQAQQRKFEGRLAGFVRKLGCLPLKRVHPAHGSSVHYAGQLPMTDREMPLTTERSGRLRGTSAVYIADGAALAYLPAKGLTLTLMANANRIGTQISDRLRAAGD